MYYYAILLQDGSVLRVAKTMDNLGAMARDTLPVIGVLAVVMMIFAWILGRWQTERLIRPINELDIEHPLENVVYEELRPLLTAMDRRNKEKAAVEDMRKEFSANVSHELKTPLTSISGYAEIMKNGLVRPEDIPNFSERIYKEAKRLITLIEDIIKLSKLDEGSVEIEKEEVDLYELSREIISRLSMQASMKHVHVSLSGEPVTYVGIRQILDEMIYNICENAIKYNVEGGSVSVWVGSTLNGPKVQVNDTGIGIPKEHQERIFERFYRVDKSHSKERGGTGLGLSIVKHGALLHNAKVSVESDTGKGTRMEILFETSQSE
jgi:two-component system phosphate regulon sensor histidine kinase PhoR